MDDKAAVPSAVLEGLFEQPAQPVQAAQNWEAYNAAQTEEKLAFLELLEDLTALIPESSQHGVGRPAASYREMTFAVVEKVYECLSSRRATSDLEISKNKGYLSKTPHFNTVIKYLNKPEMTPLLLSLIRYSALPLTGLEDTVAIDSSGLSSAFYSRWFDYRFDHDKRVKDWLKIHVCCGVKTNIVTSIIVLDGHSGDSPQFPQLLKETLEAFKARVVCADKGYSGRDNLQFAWDAGVVPVIPFRSNASNKKLGSRAWSKMYHYFQANREQFEAVYHKRSNVESTFSMIKRKFGGRLFSRKEASQVNEALAKILCHNLVVLVHEAKENKFSIDLKAAAHKLPALHINCPN